MKIPQTREELEEHLADQIQFLESSAEAFDSGLTGEAKRMAHALRILLHDTSKSHSLLGQLGRKDAKFYDTACPIDPENQYSYWGLTAVRLGSSKAKHIPFLDDSPHRTKQVDFEQWWNAPVFIDADKRVLSRKDLVLYVAHQDGGSHVDPELDEIYARLSRQNSLDWWYTYDGVRTSPQEPDRASIRQITHEVLKTLISGYPKKMITPSDGDGLIVMDPLLKPVASPKTLVPKVGRNELCLCGSGMKYKHCHGKAR